jgi:beta-hydroxylase
MLLYKWYGVNNPGLTKNYFQKDYKYVITVGVSTFRKQTKTDSHFGWLRAGIRVLYNIDPADDPGAYIVVNGVRHTWSTDGPLFIFDDTVIHQSFNLTDADRHCLFIDVVRPSYVFFLVKGVIQLLGLISTRVPYARGSSNWRLI